MLNLKRLGTGEYITLDGKYIIEKEEGFWYAIDSKTFISVVDSESTLRQIKESLEAKYYK